MFFLIQCSQGEASLTPKTRCLLFFFVLGRQTDRQAGGQAGEQADRPADTRRQRFSSCYVLYWALVDIREERDLGLLCKAVIFKNNTILA